MCRTTPKTVTKWKQAGKLVLQGLQVDVEETEVLMRRNHRKGSPIALTPQEAMLLGQKGNVKKSSFGGKVVTQRKGNAAPVSLLCTEIVRRLEAMDWKQTFDWAPEAQAERARRAARCIGWEAVQSDLRDDGHWGGFQLRITEYSAAGGLEEDAIPAGFGFELYPEDVFKAVRSEFESILSDDDREVVRLDLLPLLAHPFNEYDQPPGAPRH
jgi:hypothetical protein